MENLIAPNIHAQESPLVRKKRILVVDDSADLLMLNRAILEMDDYEVLTASSGQEALLLASSTSSADLILLDMQLGDMSGADLLVLLKENAPALLQQAPVVFVTGMEEPPVTDAAGIIKKPIEIDSFLKSVRGFIENGAKCGLYTH